MAVLRGSAEFPRLSPELAERWKRIPTAIASDAMNRGGALPARIKPVRPGARLLGQARTLQIMVADSLALHLILPDLREGEVLVIDGSGFLENACFGALAARVALKRGVAGVVVDGAARDIADLREMAMEVFVAGATPRGPHKGFGGRMDVPIAIGGIPVAPGDLVLGDDDGVVIVPLAEAETLIKKCEASLEREAEWVRLIDTGVTTADLLGLK